ncbi:MAG: DMT family transporter [Lachnospiraceae bacterium]|nr:DMT family transporter [Lachnospiraceae bacterium]
MNVQSRKLSGVLLTMSSALLYGGLPVFSNFAYLAGGNAETFNFYKSAWALPVLLALVLIRRQSLRLSGKLFGWAILAGFLAKGIVSLFLFLSYNYISGGAATTLHFMYPLFVALFGRVLFKNKMPFYKWATLLLATLSVALFIDADAGVGNIRGIFYAVLSGVLYAGYIMVVDKSGLSEVDPFVFAFYLAASGSVFSLVYGCVSGTFLFDLPVKAGLYGAGAAIATSVIAAACFQRGIRYLGGISASFFSLLEPVASCLLGAVFLREGIGGRMAAGILLILGSEVMMLWLDGKREKRKAEVGM